jgi:hypothetical protein
MTVCDVDLTEPGRIKLTTPKGKIVTLAYDQNAWTVTIDKPSTDGPEYSSFTSKWNNRPIQRILLTNKDLKAQGSLRYTISAS